MEVTAPQKSEEDLKLWFQNDLLLKIIKEGRFQISGSDPENLVVEGIDWEITERFTDHFASCPYFIVLRLKDSRDSSKHGQFNLIVKFITQNLATRGAMETDVQFYNEMVFYNETIPILRKYLQENSKVDSSIIEEICPKCYYTKIDMNDPDYAVVIMSDLRSEGFKTAQSKVELDYEHCLVSFQKIAKFHALSYAIKLDKPELYEKIKSNYKECRYPDDRLKKETWDMFFEMAASRAIDYLISKDVADIPKDYLHHLKKKVTDGAYDMMRSMITPKEPIAVLCHGDFCRNNILYKFENGKPVDCRIFDYQTFRYANPSIDLTFFVYMNTTQNLREAHFDQLFQAYYETLTMTLSEITGRDLSKIASLYPISLYVNDYAENSLYGYLIASFFLPMMMSPNRDLEDEFEKNTTLEMAQKNVKQGGEPVTIRIAGIIQDFYARKFYMPR